MSSLLMDYMRVAMLARLFTPEMEVRPQRAVPFVDQQGSPVRRLDVCFPEAESQTEAVS